MIIPQSFDETTLRTLSPVVISVLGSVRLILGGTPVPLVRESKSAHLLICLALAKEHRLSRCRILETIWPEADSTLAGQALNSLNHQLNKMSAKYLNGAGLVVHETGYYQLNAPHRVWIDIDHFAQWSEAGRQLLSTDDVAAGVSYCEQALALYQGDLCGDSSIHTLFERERLRAAFLDLLVRLAEHYYRHGDPSTTPSACWRTIPAARTPIARPCAAMYGWASAPKRSATIASAAKPWPPNSMRSQSQRRLRSMNRFAWIRPAPYRRTDTQPADLRPVRRAATTLPQPGLSTTSVSSQPPYKSHLSAP